MSRPGLDEPTQCARGAARRDGGGVALLRRAEDGRWAGRTNAELHARVRAMARGLLAAGTASGGGARTAGARR